MLRLTHQLAVIHCGIQVNRRKKEGLLPGDDSDDSRWKRSQYRARVVDTYFNDGVYPWCVPTSLEDMPHKANNIVGSTALSRPLFRRGFTSKRAGSTGSYLLPC